MSSTITISRVEHLLRELVSCGSVTPGGQDVVGPNMGEERLARLLGGKLAGLGASVEVSQVCPGRANVVGRFAGTGGGKSLMLEAHSDTVSVEGMTIDPFAGDVRDGRLYGRGACDTKGSMAAMLLAIESAIAGGATCGDVYFVSTCDEEVGASGALALMAGGFRADAAIVGEPTDLEIVHATKGTTRLAIDTHGIAAHSSMPDQGANAIYQMGRVLGVIESKIVPALAERIHPLLGPPTISVGTIRGGSQINIVPADCSIEVDRRLVPGETCEQIEAEIAATLDQLRSDDDLFNFTCRHLQGYPPFEQPRDSDVVRQAVKACEEVTGESRLVTAPWASNAGIFAAEGIASVIIGPGSISQAHRCDEFIELDQVVLAAKIYEQMILSFTAKGA